MEGITVTKPIVYGDVARYLGAIGKDCDHTHLWSVYLKSADNEDMRGYVRQVTFKLVNSVAESVRFFTEPPYRFVQYGWGEFEVVIKVYFHDPSEKPSSSLTTS